MIKNMDLLKQIIERRAKLDEVSKKLKQHFFGIDNVIDKIIKNIEVWYVMPELLTRPLIVCLWGMTGVGKTDLIRKLARHLNFHDSYVEIQLTSKGASESGRYDSGNSLKSLMSYSNLEPDRPGILLLDEIQRFRTVAQDGDDIHGGDFQDLWMLLSDGKFSNDYDIKNELLKMLCDIAFRKDGGHAYDDEIEDGTDRSKKKYKWQHYSAQTFKKMLRLKESVEEIMTWDEDTRKSVIIQKISDYSAYSEEDYSKTLIFVSGNLDEAYKMAASTDEAEMDADIFYNNSLKINMLHVKRALRQRFRPEQIARFGNVHIIYPSLSKKAYQDIINSKASILSNSISEKFGINITIDQTLKDAIYRNGVFPVQGTRPLFSTISSMLENSVPSFVLGAVTNGQKDFLLRYDSTSKEIVAKMGEKEMRYKTEGDIDLIRDKQFNKDIHAATAVHECGHAVVYALLFNMAPTQISATHSSIESEGFVAFHDIDLTAKYIKNKIAIVLAGQVAEEIFFGRDSLTAGCAGDIRAATRLASDFIRNYGMSTFVSKISAPFSTDDLTYNNDFAPTDKIIEDMLRRERGRAEALLKENKDLLKDLSKTLYLKKTIEPEEMRSICHAHGLKIGVGDAGVILVDNFAEKLAHKTA
jgi:hypothetical protein